MQDDDPSDSRRSRNAIPGAFTVGEGPVDAQIVDQHYPGGHVRVTAETDDGENVILMVDPPAVPNTAERRLNSDTDRVDILES